MPKPTTPPPKGAPGRLSGRWPGFVAPNAEAGGLSTVAELLVSCAVEDGLPRVPLRDLIVTAEHVPLAVPATHLAHIQAGLTEALGGHEYIVVHLAADCR